MEIKNKTSHDPIADVPIVDAYFCWALQAGEEVAGKQGVQNILREVGLERLIDNYPPDELQISGKYTIGEYAGYLAALQTSLGRAAKSLMPRVGRFSAKHGLDRQGALYGAAAVLSAKLPQMSRCALPGLARLPTSWNGSPARNLTFARPNAWRWVRRPVFGKSIRPQKDRRIAPGMVHCAHAHPDG